MNSLSSEKSKWLVFTQHFHINSFSWNRFLLALKQHQSQCANWHVQSPLWLTVNLHKPKQQQPWRQMTHRLRKWTNRLPAVLEVKCVHVVLIVWVSWWGLNHWLSSNGSIAIFCGLIVSTESTEWPSTPSLNDTLIWLTCPPLSSERNDVTVHTLWTGHPPDPPCFVAVFVLLRVLLPDL